MGEVITCVLVQLADGRRIWISIRDYKANPDRGSYSVNETRKRG